MNKLVINANLLAKPISKAQSNKIAEELSSATKPEEHPFLGDNVSRAYEIKLYYPTHEIKVPIFGTAQEAIAKAEELSKELGEYKVAYYAINYRNEQVYVNKVDDGISKRTVFVAEIKAHRRFRKPLYRREVYLSGKAPKRKKNEELVSLTRVDLLAYSKSKMAVTVLIGLLDNLTLTKDLSNGKYSAKTNG